MQSAAATSRASNYSASNVYPDSYVAARHRDVDRVASSGTPAGSRGNTFTKPDQPRSQQYPRTLFRPGMIVRAALHGKLCILCKNYGLWDKSKQHPLLDLCPIARIPNAQTNADVEFVERTYALNLTPLGTACGKLATRPVSKSCSGPGKPTLTLNRVQRITEACLEIQR